MLRELAAPAREQAASGELAAGRQTAGIRRRVEQGRAAVQAEPAARHPPVQRRQAAALPQPAAGRERVAWVQQRAAVACSPPAAMWELAAVSRPVEWSDLADHLEAGARAPPAQVAPGAVQPLAALQNPVRLEARQAPAWRRRKAAAAPVAWPRAREPATRGLGCLHLPCWHLVFEEGDRAQMRWGPVRNRADPRSTRLLQLALLIEIWRISISSASPSHICSSARRRGVMASKVGRNCG